jgi:hypothetical protein
VTLHDRNVNCVAGRELRPILNDFPGTQDIALLDGEHIAADTPGQVECGLDRFPLVDGGVSMKNFLQDFAAGHETFAGSDQALQ